VTERKTKPEIAAILGLSPRTVGNHLARKRARLGVQTRTGAARIALTVR
jgi:DNA-binding CsgD family transcriptional regulator